MSESFRHEIDGLSHFNKAMSCYSVLNKTHRGTLCKTLIFTKLSFLQNSDFYNKNRIN